jgi:hypothetical protein
MLLVQLKVRVGPCMPRLAATHAAGVAGSTPKVLVAWIGKIGREGRN